MNIEKGTIRMNGVNDNTIRGWALMNANCYVAGSFRVTLEALTTLKAREEAQQNVALRAHYATLTIGNEAVILPPNKD